MALTVKSPHSGQPVKVREEDLGRALRDEGGRVFYALQTADGAGVYGAVTRKGSPDEEARYANGQWRLTPEQLAEAASKQGVATGLSGGNANQPHDATGPGRKKPKSRFVVYLVAIALLAGGGYWAYETWLAPGSEVPAPGSGDTLPTETSGGADDATPAEAPASALDATEALPTQPNRPAQPTE